MADNLISEKPIGSNLSTNPNHSASKSGLESTEEMNLDG